MCHFFLNYDFIGKFLIFFGISIFWHFFDKKHIFLKKDENFQKKNVFVNNADLIPVRMVYHTSMLRIRNIALLNRQNSVFSVFSVRKERQVENSPNRVPPPYAFC